MQLTTTRSTPVATITTPMSPAEEDDTSTDYSTSNASDDTTMISTKGPAPLRKGKWTTEEEAYVNKLVDGFNSGLLTLSRGTTLRSYLAAQLHW